VATFLTIPRNKKIVLILICLGIVLLLLPNLAHGATATCGKNMACHFRAALVWLVLLITYAVGSLGGAVLSLAALVVDFVLDKNFEILLFSPGTFSGNVISQGFSYSRNVANIGFVFAIIAIAFATIFRSQSYGMKQMLWKLVVAAVLINFSLLIAGVIIDFSHVATKSLQGVAEREIVKNTGLNPNDINLSDGLGKLISPSEILKPPNWTTAQGAAASADSVRKMLNLILAAGFVALFIWVTAVVVLAIGIMFLARLIYLSILLILMPLAWLFWVMPKYNHLSKNWWDRFLQQVFYLPAVMFFIALAMTLVRSNFGSPGAKFAGSAIGEPLASFVIGLFLILGLLIGGLIAGQKMGGAGASLAMNFAKGAKNKVGKPMLRYATKPVTEPISRAGKATARGLGRGLNFVGTAGGTGAGRVMRRIPIVGGLMRATSGTGAKIIGAAEKGRGKDGLKKQTDEFAKSYPTEIARQARYEAGFGNREDAAVALLEALKNGELGDLFEAQRGNESSLIAAARSYGITTELSRAMPNRAHEFASNNERDEVTRDLARTLGVAIGNVTGDQINNELRRRAVRGAKGSDIKNYTEDIATVRDATNNFVDQNVDILVNMSGSQYSMLERSEDMSETTKQAFRDGYREILEESTNPHGSLNLTTEQQDSLGRLTNYITNNPALNSLYH
jgi:hypothetical protein